MTMYMPSYHAVPRRNKLPYPLSVLGVSLLVMLKRTKILACMPESQPYGGDARTADCQLRRRVLSITPESRYTCNSAQETVIDAVSK